MATELLERLRRLREGEKKPKKPPVVPKEPEGYIFDYDLGEFVPATKEQVAERERLYAQYPEIAPPGVPGKITPTEYEELRLAEVEERKRVFAPVFPQEDIDVMLRGMVVTPEMPEMERLTAEQAQEDFLDKLEQIGRTPETESILRQVGFEEEQIAEFFPPGILAPAITIEGDVIEQPAIETFWDALVLGSKQLLHRTAQYFVSTIPSKLFRDVKAGVEIPVTGMVHSGLYYTPEEAEELNRKNREQRDKFREIYARNQTKFEEWIEKHPELEAPPQYKRDVTQHPEMLKDPGFWAYAIGEALPFSLGVLGTTLGVTFLTKNPYIGLTAGTAIATPAQSQDLYEDLIASGAPEDRAADIAVPVGMVIASIEAVTDLPLLKAISPAFNLLKRNIQQAAVKSTMGGLFKKGITTFVTIETAEVLEEVAQGAIHNAFVKTYDENRQIFENLDETVIRTLIATSPLAIFGGGMSLRHIPSVEATTVSPEQKKAEGWKQDTITNEWYKPEKIVDSFNEDATKAEEAGLNPDQAQLTALNEAARTLEGEKAIREYVKELEKPAIPEVAPEATLSLDVISKYETRIPLDLIRKDEKAYLERLTRKIEKEGITEPITIRIREDGSRIVWDGIHRLIVAQNLGIQNVPVRFIGEPLVAKVPPPAVEEVKPPTPEEISKTRQTIMSWVKTRGFTQKQYRDMFMEYGKHRQLHLMTPEQLQDVLAQVKVARPRIIKGKRVVTQKTEKKIQTLKDTLIRNKQLTEKSFNHIVGQLKLPTTRYETATKFITESEAKTLIRAMNDEAVLAEWDIKVEEALDRHPDIKTARDGLNARSVRTKEVTFDGVPIRVKRGNELRSMRFYVLKLQKELNAPIYDIWQKINMAHLAIRQKQKDLINKLEQSTPEFMAIVKDEEALTRVENYIAAKHRMGPKSPPNITAEEIKLATELERQLFEFRNDVRYARFAEAYAGHSGDVDMIARDIPDANKRALRRAADIFEGRGATELRKFLDTQEWGVIRTGYDPRSIVKPKLHLYTARPTTFAKGHIQTRRGVEYTTEDRTIIQRYRSYTKQMMGLTDLSPLVRAFDRVFTEHAPKLANYRPVANVLSRGMNEMKGYREDGGFLIHMMERMYATVASAVFWRPDLVLRNKFQNFAFNPDFHAGLFLLPRKALTEQRRLWFETFVSQEKGIEQDYLLYSERPLPGLKRLTDWAHRTSLYPWSDKSNRAECFQVRIDRVDRALIQYEKDGDLNRLINNSGLLEFEPRQQAEALELLVMDKVDYGIERMPAVSGYEAFALYNAQQLTNNVHFLYDRAQRAPAEMGASGKTLGNILVFSRSWGERLVLQGNKLADPKATTRERILATRIIVGIVVAGLIAGEGYKWLTGKTHNPYNPLNILTWTPGGLIVGVAEDISNVIYWMTQAIQGNEKALGQLPGLITIAATLTLPFYKNFIQAVDSITDMKGIDVYAIRKIREMIDEEYEVRGGVHEVERTLFEKLQHALLAGKDKPDTPQEKASDAEEMLGQIDEDWEDLPYSAEEPPINDMRKLNSDYGRILKDIPPEDITKANKYSTKAIGWVEKEASESIWQMYPNVALYKINADPKEGDTFEEYYRQWRLPKEEREAYERAYLGNFSQRELSLLRQYHALDKAHQAEFLEKHPELKVNLRDEWLKENPEDNARLAIWGQAKILSLDAYNETKRLVKVLDIPDDAIPEFTLPPKGSVENYFKYGEVGEELGYNSWEVQLIIAKDDALREWLGREPIETPLRSLELKVKHRDLFDQLDAYGDKDSPLYIEDDEARDEARDKLKADNPKWVDDMRRIEAIGYGASEDVIESWVERGRVVDEFNAGSSEAKVWLVGHKEVWDWALEQELLTDDGTDWNVNVLRLNAKWREQDEAYEAFTEDEDREAYLVRNIEYHKDRRRRDVYSIEGFPEKQIETYVDWYTNESLKKPEDYKWEWYEDDWYLMEHPEFHQALVSSGVWSEKRDFSKVPSREVNKLYLIYLGLPAGQTRLDYRAQNPTLNKWLISTKGLKPLEGRGDEGVDISRWEKLAKELADIEERLKKLRE